MKQTLNFLAVAALSLSATMASAQSFPTRPVTIIVPYSPGSTDTMARTLAQDMSETLGQPVVVETRPGAGGSVGATAVVNADPDGYTILMAVSSVQTVAPHQRELSYGFDDLLPIARVSVGPNVIAARNGAPFTTIPELVAYARENPGVVSYGSAGTGGATHIAAEAIAQAAGIDLFHIPFGGVTPAITATIAGDVDLVLGFASAILPRAESGQLVPLAQLSDERTSLAPDLSTLREADLDLALPPNIGLWAPAGTPEDVIAALAAAIETSATGETFSEFAANALVEIDVAGPEEFLRVLQAEDAFYAALLPTIDFTE
ncbi:Bug family tripartite tricarboxylate transporter substrate binding protein [Pararhodobacter oceanensis]|uniref:Bug family tripartite tricarboxylate transporter substrate binding protein n=1 Tax=Pararhodobacter oceanensis TaxID=2172121 RepID=UPI003A90654C